MEYNKKCTGCNHTKHIEEFSKNKSRKDGLQSHCKGCQSENSKSQKIAILSDLTDEVWLDVVGYEGLYAVSNKGRVKSLSRVKINQNGCFISQEQLLSEKTEANGYKRVTLCQNSKKNTHSVHRLVAISFIENHDDKQEVNHKNKLRGDNSVNNLEWVTKRENQTHRFIGQNKKRASVGVYKETRYNGWVVKVNLNNKEIYVGSYGNKDEAQLAYKNKLIELGVDNKYVV